MYWSTAFAALWFASTALAQGSAGGDQSSCSASQAWLYKGCYNDTDNARTAGFSWQLQSSTNDPKCYPGFTGSNNMTTEICLQACRGHGFKWAATWAGVECYCGSEFPMAQNPSSTTSGPSPPPGAAPGTPTDNAACNTPCTGNSSETCGSGSTAQLYFDPSFSNNTQTASDPNQYKYLGCFDYAPPGPMYMTIQTTSTASCVTYCGLLGYPFSARGGPDTDTGGNTCGCGSEIQAGLQLDESRCGTYCNGTGGAS